MNELIDHWQRLRLAVQLMENASVHNITERAYQMSLEREEFDAFFTTFVLDNLKAGK